MAKNVRTALMVEGYFLDGVESPFPLTRLSGKIEGLEKDIEAGIIEDFAVIPAEIHSGRPEDVERYYDIYVKRKS